MKFEINSSGIRIVPETVHDKAYVAHVLGINSVGEGSCSVIAERYAGSVELIALKIEKAKPAGVICTECGGFHDVGSGGWCPPAKPNEAGS